MAAVREGATYSASQKAFALERAVSGSARADGRGPEEIRQLRFVLGRAPNGRASATVHLGDTKALAVVTGEVVAPFLDRPTEGQLLFQVDISAMAEPGGSAWGGRRSALAVEAARIIERGLRDSQALDTEALCIIAGERVWSIRVDVKVLDLNGNAIDAASLAAIAALHHYRRPEVQVSEGRVLVTPEWDAEPEPLAIHHSPICVTFGLFPDGDGASTNGIKGVIDPSAEEEACMGGRITYCLTPHAELCTLHKNGGLAMPAEGMLKLAELASRKVKTIYSQMTRALSDADRLHCLARDERLRGCNGRPSNAHMLTTPFSNEAAPMEVDEGALSIDHLDYNELHVTGKLRVEEPQIATGTKSTFEPSVARSGAVDELSDEEEVVVLDSAFQKGEDEASPKEVKGTKSAAAVAPIIADVNSDEDDLAAAVKTSTKGRKGRKGKK